MQALWLLFRMRSAAAIRRHWRQCKTIEGFIKTLFTFAFLSMLCVPTLVGFLQSDGPIPPEYIDKTRAVVSNLLPCFIGVMFYFTLVTPKSSETLEFSQPEIDFLFSGPFSRKELLAYRLLGVFTSSVLYSFGICVFLGSVFFFLGGSVFWNFVRGFLAAYFVLISIRLAFIISSLIKDTIAQKLYSPFRKIGAAVTAVVGLIVFFRVRKNLDLEIFKDHERLWELFQSIFQIGAVQVAISPFRIFSNLIVAQSVPSALLWIVLCASFCALLVFMIFKTDSNFVEGSLYYSQKKMELLKQTASVETSFLKQGYVRSLPMLPFMNGIGPIAWRQLQTFYRSKTLIIVGVGMYFIFILPLLSSESPRNEPFTFRFSTVMSSLGMFTFLGATIIPMGFQTDIDRMDIFKSLPFSSLQITAGQLLGPTVALGGYQLATIVVFSFSALEYWPYWLAAAAYAPLYSILLLCILNSLALIYPSKRREVGATSDLDSIGQILIYVFLVGVVSATLFIVLGGIGVGVWFATKSELATYTICWFVLIAFCIGGVWITSRFFDRFDVSKHGL